MFFFCSHHSLVEVMMAYSLFSVALPVALTESHCQEEHALYLRNMQYHIFCLFVLAKL